MAERNGISSGDNPRELSLGEYSDRDGGGLDSDPRLSRNYTDVRGGGVGGGGGRDTDDERERAHAFARQLIASVLTQSRSDPFYAEGCNPFIAHNEGACSCSG